MLKIDKSYITEDMLTIVNRLKVALPPEGAHLLQKVKRSGTNLLVTCPFHKDGREKNPSCIINTEQNDKYNVGDVYCFSCKTFMPFDRLVSYCFGIVDDGAFGRNWLTDNFISATERTLTVNMDRPTMRAEYVSEEELSTYRFYHPYMYERGFTNELIEQFDIGYDRNFEGIECLTFPVRDINKKTLFITRRAINMKMFDYPRSTVMPLYGIYELFTYGDVFKGNPTDVKKPLFICESVIDCITCWKYGQQAIALNGLGSKLQIDALKYIIPNQLVLALDNDAAGNKAKNRLALALQDFRDVVCYPFPNDKKDINDLTEEEFNSTLGGINCELKEQT